jgi:PAS domain S-box-containing protein
VSASLHTILGYTPDQVLGHNWREFIDPNDPVMPELEKLERLRFAGVPIPPFRAPVLHADGSTRLFEFRDVPLQDANGRVIANEGIGKDITKRHEAEEALRRVHEELERRVQERTAELTAMYERLRDSEQRYRSVVEDHLEFIIRWCGDGVRTFVNESYCRYCNASREDLIGSNFMSSIVEEDRESLMQKIAAVTMDCPVVVHEHRIIAADGRTVWERWSHRALFSPQGELIEFQSVGCDVTERRKREEHALERASAVEQLRQLTERERDVLQLVVAGDANKVVAKKLALSVKTIEKHRSSLMRKLHVRSVPELVRLAMLIEESRPV